MIDKTYLDSRASIEYSSHDEMQMSIIVCKIRDELIRRYGDRVDLIKDKILNKLVEDK